MLNYLESHKGRIISVFFLILVIVMATATIVFISRSCQSDRYASELKVMPTYSGEIKLVYLSKEEESILNNDSTVYVPLADYKKSIYQLNNKILKGQTELLKRQEDLVLDIRQETNNNLEKESAWLAFWITVLTIVGVVCPLGYQIINFNTEKEKLNQLEKKTGEIEKKNNEINEGYFVKMNILTFNLLSESRLEESEAGEVREIFITSIKNHYKEFLNGLEYLSKDWPGLQVHLCSVLISLHAFLYKLNIRSDFEQSGKIRDILDLISMTLKKIPEATDLNNIRRDLTSIEIKLMRI